VHPPHKETDVTTFAADYPFLDILWSMIIFFAWVAWIWVLIVIIGDLFRRSDTSGFAKALWVIFLIVLPFIGVLVYLIANSQGMADRTAERARAGEEQMAAYVRSVSTSGGGGAASEIEKAKQLLDSGTITQAEFDGLKAKALA
jgi:general stress protein CsbA